MIRVVIADDESGICKMLENMIDWTRLGFKIVGCAQDGITLYNLIIEDTPDLVITDIKMPGMDGLDVLQKTLHLNTKFIIISGYDDFVYAKTAIEFGVLQYLLKPVDSDELERAVLSAKKQIFSFHTSDNTSLQRALLESSSKSFELYLQNLMSISAVNVHDIDYINNVFMRHFTDELFIIFSVSASLRQGKVSADREKNHVVNRSICSVLEKNLTDISAEIFTFSIGNICYLLINYSRSKATDIIQQTKSSFSDIIHSSMYTSQYDITIGIGKPVDDIKDIRRSFEHSNAALRSRIIVGENSVIEISENKLQKNMIEKLFVNDIKKLLSSCITAENHETIQATVDKIYYEKIAAMSFSSTDIFELTRKIVDFLLDSMTSYVSQKFFSEYSRNDIYKNIEECATILELDACVCECINKIHMISNPLNDTTSTLIAIIKQYIDEHYNENIHLEDIAKQVFLHPNYVSEIFKQETGINFSKYLIQKRMEMAKIYLLDIRYRVNDVASLVGYNDSKHFSKLFKSYVGMTPAAFRKMFA